MNKYNKNNPALKELHRKIRNSSEQLIKRPPFAEQERYQSRINYFNEIFRGNKGINALMIENVGREKNNPAQRVGNQSTDNTKASATEVVEPSPESIINAISFYGESFHDFMGINEIISQTIGRYRHNNDALQILRNRIVAETEAFRATTERAGCSDLYFTNQLNATLDEIDATMSKNITPNQLDTNNQSTIGAGSTENTAESFMEVEPSSKPSVPNKLARGTSVSKLFGKVGEKQIPDSTWTKGTRPPLTKDTYSDPSSSQKRPGKVTRDSVVLRVRAAGAQSPISPGTIREEREAARTSPQKSLSKK
jgi:hypothetical protein